MEAEILNVDYHVRRLLLKALNKFNCRKEQAQALGVSIRTVYRLMERFEVENNNGVAVSKRKLNVELDVML
jgi:hypothetical protein